MSRFQTHLNSSLFTLGIAALGLTQTACTTKNYYEQYYELADAGGHQPPPSNTDEPEPESGPDAPDSGGVEPEPTDSDAGGPWPVEEGAPIANTEREALPLDVLGTAGNRYWFVVSDEEVERMNEFYGGGGPIFLFNLYGDIYTPGGGDADPTFVDHLLATPKNAPTQTADYGKVQVRLVGESTGRPWTGDSLPNLKLDSDEFQEGNRIGDVEHVRFNNAVVGSIFREKLTLDLYRKLGYPAPRATYAWVSSSVWGPDTAIPYVVVESYKRQFCKQREDELGGGCVNMWEFAGDFGQGAFDLPQSCQFHECDSSRVNQFEDAVMQTPAGEGFKEGIAEYLDWDSFHRFQCLSWILGTGDDAIHNMNNLVLAERMDGKFQLLPYSVDISLGQDWYADVPLPGSSSLATGCQNDPQCWADTIATCEGLVEEFTQAKPVQMLNQMYEELEAEGMLRAGDEGRYDTMKAHIQRRLKELPDDLELNRDQPYYGYTCDYPMIDCGGYCAYPEECYLCDPVGPIGEPEPRPIPLRQELVLDGGVDDEQADPIVGLPPIVVPEPVPVPEPVDGGVVEPEPPPVDGCLPYVELY